MKHKKIFWLPIFITVSIFSAYKWHKKFSTPKFPQLVGAHEILDDTIN